ncbi:delta-aminolevulinic acid dehydratase [Raoultibacter phocaeensis]|uniref:delta-aminolevulinic acid dehydratase n=1 Tax=Raoultibacter phocaeensis TaxID=2479841 RepID=UPI00111956AB|nr:delta-aminolevulinic acid dehydratase [Raoultibacter phocaeensis]
MGVAALAEPQTIKISSKRQITIPAKIYEEAGFGEYALCTWTEQGLLLQPLDVDDEDVTVDILRYLVEQGREGEELIEQYREMKRKIVPLQKRIAEAELDIAEGRVGPAREMQERMRKKYGLYDR